MARPSGQPKRARFEVSVVPRLVPEDLEAELQADEAEEAEEAEVAEDAVEEEDEDLDKDEDEDDSKGITLDPDTVAYEHHSEASSLVYFLKTWRQNFKPTRPKRQRGAR